MKPGKRGAPARKGQTRLGQIMTAPARTAPPAPAAPEAPAKQPKQARQAKQPKQTAPAGGAPDYKRYRQGRAQLAFWLDEGLVSRVKDAAWFLRESTHDIARRALEAELDRLAKKNGGKLPSRK